MGAKAKQKSTGKRASRRTNISHSEQEDVQGKENDNEENQVVDEEMISPENPDQDYQEKEPSEISLEAADSIPIRLKSIFIYMYTLLVYLFVCILLTLTDLTDRDHIFCGTSRDPREGL